jgi:hypothetical protein
MRDVNLVMRSRMDVANVDNLTRSLDLKMKAESGGSIVRSSSDARDGRQLAGLVKFVILAGDNTE